MQFLCFGSKNIAIPVPGFNQNDNKESLTFLSDVTYKGISDCTVVPLKNSTIMYMHIPSGEGAQMRPFFATVGRKFKDFLLS